MQAFVHVALAVSRSVTGRTDVIIDGAEVSNATVSVSAVSAGAAVRGLQLSANSERPNVSAF